jgi:hypothetical protein
MSRKGGAQPAAAHRFVNEAVALLFCLVLRLCYRCYPDVPLLHLTRQTRVNSNQTSRKGCKTDDAILLVG